MFVLHYLEQNLTSQKGHSTDVKRLFIARFSASCHYGLSPPKGALLVCVIVCRYRGIFYSLINKSTRCSPHVLCKLQSQVEEPLDTDSSSLIQNTNIAFLCWSMGNTIVMPFYPWSFRCPEYMGQNRQWPLLLSSFYFTDPCTLLDSYQVHYIFQNLWEKAVLHTTFPYWILV